MRRSARISVHRSSIQSPFKAASLSRMLSHFVPLPCTEHPERSSGRRRRFRAIRGRVAAHRQPPGGAGQQRTGSDLKWRFPPLAAPPSASPLPHRLPSLATGPAGLNRILRWWVRTESCALSFAVSLNGGSPARARRGAGLDLRGERIGRSACSAAWTGVMGCRRVTRPTNRRMDRIERVERIGPRKTSPMSKAR